MVACPRVKVEPLLIRRLLLFPLPSFLFPLFLFRRLRFLLLTLRGLRLRLRWSALLWAIVRGSRALGGLLPRRLRTIGIGTIRVRTIRLWTLVRLRRSRTIGSIRPIRARR